MRIIDQTLRRRDTLRCESSASVISLNAAGDNATEEDSFATFDVTARCHKALYSFGFLIEKECNPTTLYMSPSRNTCFSGESCGNAAI